jgi:hypothetical protein
MSASSETATIPARQALFDVRLAAEHCVAAWLQQQQLQQESASTKNNNNNSNNIHVDCRVVTVTESDYTIVNGSDFDLLRFLKQISPDRVSDDDDSQTISAIIKAIDLLKLANGTVSTVAGVHVQIDTHVGGWLVFLYTNHNNKKWECISAAFGYGNDEQVASLEDFEQLKECTWSGYVSANRACNGPEMAKVFHKDCRLTYVDTAATGDDPVVIVSHDDFIHKVSHRYEMEPHVQYAHLRTDDPRLSEHDALISGQFATLRVAMVKLKVGHPPCLWTDLLTCVKLPQGAEKDNNKWMILHKSSCCDLYLVDDKAKTK